MVSILDKNSDVIEYQIVPGWDIVNKGFGSNSIDLNLENNKNPIYLMQRY